MPAGVTTLARRRRAALALAALAVVSAAALGWTAPGAAASTWYVSGTITNSTSYTASFPEYETDCPGGSGVRSGNWIKPPPATIAPGASATYKFDAPHFGEGAHMCIAYEILAGEDQERIQTWTITADDAIAQSPWASCQNYYPEGNAGCSLAVSGSNKNVTANYQFYDCEPLGGCAASGGCVASKPNDTPELCEWFTRGERYPGDAGQVVGLRQSAGILGPVGLRGGALSIRLARPALVRIPVVRHLQSGKRALRTRERVLAAGLNRIPLRLGPGRYTLVVIACRAAKRCSTRTVEARIPPRR